MDLPVLAAIQPQQAAPQSAQDALGAAFPKEVGQGQKVGTAAAGVQTEFGKQFARAYVESILSRRFGFSVHIPDEEEEAFRKAQKATAMATMARQEAEANASGALTSLLNLPPDVLKKNGLSLQSVLTEPEKVVAFVNARGLSPKPLALGDLFNVGVGSPAFAQQWMQFDPEARAAAGEAAAAEAQQKAISEAMTMESKVLSLEKERAQQPAAIAKADFDTAALVEEYGRGGGVYGPGKKETVAAAEKAFDVDIGRGLDEAHGKGSAALFAAYNAEQKRVGTKLRSTAPVAQAFSKEYGGDIKDALEELPIDKAGNILVGQPGQSALDPVDAEATLGLAAAALRLSKDLGQESVRDLFLSWGMKASGVDPVSFVDALITQAAKAKPQDAFREAAARLQEYGLLEEFGETFLARITQAADAEKGK